MIRAFCHCGAVQLDIAERPETLTECNCSICRRYAARWAYYPGSAVRVIAEPASLQKYVWGTGEIAFVRCATCGSVMFWEATGPKAEDARLGINARMLDPGDTAGIPVRMLDGADTWKYQD